MTYTCPDFTKLQVGDTVSRHGSGGGYGYLPEMSKHTVTKKTATQITIDIGERYTGSLHRIGDRSGGYNSRSYSLSPWDDTSQERMDRVHENIRKCRVLEALKAITWVNISEEQRDQALHALKAIGVWKEPLNV